MGLAISMDQAVRVGVWSEDKLATNVALEFVGRSTNPAVVFEEFDGIFYTLVENNKRTRAFIQEPRRIERKIVFDGRIDLHPDGFLRRENKVVVCSVPVKVCLVDALSELKNGFDWLIYSTKANPTGIFTTNSEVAFSCLPLNEYQKVIEEAQAPERLIVFGSIKHRVGDQRENQIRLAANHLSAKISHIFASPV